MIHSPFSSSLSLSTSAEYTIDQALSVLWPSATECTTDQVLSVHWYHSLLNVSQIKYWVFNITLCWMYHRSSTEYSVTIYHPLLNVQLIKHWVLSDYLSISVECTTNQALSAQYLPLSINYGLCFSVFKVFKLSSGAEPTTGQQANRWNNDGDSALCREQWLR